MLTHTHKIQKGLKPEWQLSNLQWEIELTGRPHSLARLFLPWRQWTWRIIRLIAEHEIRRNRIRFKSQTLKGTGLWQPTASISTPELVQSGGSGDQAGNMTADFFPRHHWEIRPQTAGKTDQERGNCESLEARLKTLIRASAKSLWAEAPYAWHDCGKVTRKWKTWARRIFLITAWEEMEEQEICFYLCLKDLLDKLSPFLSVKWKYFSCFI